MSLTPRREATVARLLEAAVDQFAAHGIDATTVEQICEAAGFSRGAFYSNFATKNDLCAALIRQLEDRITATLDEVLVGLKPVSDPSQVVSLIIQKVGEVVTFTPEITVTLLEIKLRAQRNPELKRLLSETEEQTRPTQVAFVEQACEILGVKFRLPADQLVTLFEALFFYDAHNRETKPARGLMLPIATALIEPQA